ncbi:MAG: hypothetical protein A3G81_22495 [Betaproteobacteria bacterium RIFCSPLOWO2_12_FULL_65_14]|nr:MAG: hypothetical protein A3G81_22495 [Betaproteobacteria bacterium RIFCSPLOWO2_12_FULL_65_14]
MILRRIERQQIELRELTSKAGIYIHIGSKHYLDPEERKSRAHAVRRWLEQDRAKLRALLGAKAASA